MNKPVVSVVLATYNHAPFVSEAIESVFSQIGVSFELLVADDGSTDDTPKIVRRYESDPRVSFVAHPANRGACVVTNELIDKANGEYVALINSDDVWLSQTKLADQVAFLANNAHVGAIFGRPVFMDEQGREIPKHDVPFGPLFDQTNRTQAAWLRFFFDHGNCLCHPTMLIRKSCYEKLGGYDNRLRQLPDFDMWVRLVKHFQIHISDESWVRFRYRPGKNTSSPTIGNRMRDMNEHFLIGERFFDGVTPATLQDAFADLLPLGFGQGRISCDVACAMLLLDHSNGPFLRARRLLAFLKLRELLGRGDSAAQLLQHYNFDDRAFQERLAGEDCLTIDAEWTPVVPAHLKGQLTASEARFEEASRQVFAYQRELQRPLLSLIVRLVKAKLRKKQLLQ
jgi:glycosyltransferase involved in cell wall biosynthesis